MKAKYERFLAWRDKSLISQSEQTVLYIYIHRWGQDINKIVSEAKRERGGEIDRGREREVQSGT